MFNHQALAFHGDTFDAQRDGKRLAAQLTAVRALMSDGMPHTLAEVAAYAKCSTASASSRIRDLRKRPNGGHTIDRQYIDNGVWSYRMVLASVPTLNGSAG